MCCRNGCNGYVYQFRDIRIGKSEEMSDLDAMVFMIIALVVSFGFFLMFGIDWDKIYPE